MTFSFQGTPERKLASDSGNSHGDNTNKDRDSGIHGNSTVAGLDVSSAPPMDMSVDIDDDSGSSGGPPHPQLHREHHPGPVHLSRDPSTDIPLDPALAESHYLDVDDFEADDSESEVHHDHACVERQDTDSTSLETSTHPAILYSHWREIRNKERTPPPHSR